MLEEYLWEITLSGTADFTKPSLSTFKFNEKGSGLEKLKLYLENIFQDDGTTCSLQNIKF